MIEDTGEDCPEENVCHDVEICSKEMRLQFAALKDGSADTDHEAIEEGILPVRSALKGRPVGNGEPEPSGERRQGERKNEAIVETISEEEKEQGSRQEI